MTRIDGKHLPVKPFGIGELAGLMAIEGLFESPLNRVRRIAL
jgi:hypothetical protein